MSITASKQAAGKTTPRCSFTLWWLISITYLMFFPLYDSVRQGGPKSKPCTTDWPKIRTKSY